MSVLILKKGPKIVGSTSCDYSIIRQSHKLDRNRIILESIPHKMRFGSYTYPDFGLEGVNSGYGKDMGHLKMRGSDTSLDLRWFSVPDEWTDNLEMALVEFNRHYGNNKCIDVEDVIWQE